MLITPASASLHDPVVLRLAGGTFGFLAVASGVGFLLGRRTVNASEGARRTIANLNARLRAWWVIVALCTLALLFGRVGAAVLFGLVSFQAMREFVALVPMQADDRRAMLWISLFFVVTQYWLVANGSSLLFLVFLPVGVFLCVPVWAAIRGGGENYLSWTAALQWGLIICIYNVSHAPALLSLSPANGNTGLLAFFLLVVQLNDVFQYIWGKLLGRYRIVPRLSPNKTWEGFLGGTATATAVGASLWWVTPFAPWQAAVVSLLIALLGFAGGLTMSAVKRDRGIKDFGALVAGHGGVLDRVDSVCFAAPVFFHLTRYYLISR